MEIQILDMLLKIQKMQEEMLINQKGIKQDIEELIEMQLKDEKQVNAKFEFIKENFNKQYGEIINLNYKLHLLKTLD